MEPLTYEELFDAVRIEKSRDSLQELSEDFYKRAARYIEDKKKFIELKLKDATFNKEEREKEIRHLENVKRLVKDLYSLRERKVLALAVYYARTQSELIDTSNLLPHEKELFDKITKVLLEEREKNLIPVVEGKKEIKQKGKESDAEEEITIKILDEIPKFVGPNNIVYGPFSEGDILDLPKEIANILINRGKAVKIDEELEEE